MGKVKAKRVDKRRVMMQILAATLAATSILGLLAPVTAHASSSSRDKIESVSVKLELDEYDDYGFPIINASTSSDKYTVEECYRKELDEDVDEEDDDNYYLSDSHPLTNEVYIIVLKCDEDEYKFSLNKDDVKLKKFTTTVTNTSTKENSSELRITFKFSDLGEFVGNVNEDNVYLEGCNLYWSTTSLAQTYNIKVSGKRTANIEGVEGTSYDLGPIATREGEYKIRLYPVSQTGSVGDYIEQYLYVTADMAQQNCDTYNATTDGSLATFSTWTPGWNGVNGYWTWREAESGAMPQTQWLFNDGKWYYFGSNKILIQNAWVESKGVWYFMGSDGAMLTDQMTPDGYFVGSDGSRQG